MALESLKDDIKERDEDIEKLYSHLNLLDENDELCKILKANFLIMLYNKVEFFFREFIFSIYDAIHDQDVNFFELDPHIQKTISNYLFPKDCNKNNKHQILRNLFDGYIKYYKPNAKDLANGNIDGESLKDVLGQYQINGVCIYFSGSIKLHTLKDIRNKLAHGEKAFSDIGGNYTKSDLANFKDDIARIFLDIQDKLEIFLNDKKYLNGSGC